MIWLMIYAMRKFARMQNARVFLKNRCFEWLLNLTASLQPSGLSSLLAAIRCSLATERASHVAGRSSDRPAKLPGAVRHRRAVSGLSFRGALAGRFLLHGLRPCRRLSSQEASDRRVRGLRQAALAPGRHDLRADQDRLGALVSRRLPRHLQQARHLRHGAAAADGL